MRSLLHFFFNFLILTTFWPHQSITVGNTTVKPPNLIIILTDDHGYHDVGFNGCTDIKTPNLDSLARNGIRFTQGYVSYPVCGPSRAGLLTGRYQDRFGFNTNPKNSDPSKASEMEGMPLEEENIAEVLKKVGYKSAVIGKWHMGTHPVLHPLNRGFDHFFGFLSGGHVYFPKEINDLSEVENSYDSYCTQILNDHKKINITDYLTDELTDAANRFIDRQASSDPDSPFLLYLAYNAPHGPMQATQKYLDHFPNITNIACRTYAAMVSVVDDGVGHVLENLRNHEIEEDTLVVFLSDNGGAGGPHGSSNFPLHGFKSSLFEGRMHVPFAMQWKGTLPAGQDYNYPIISLDIMATITNLAGANISSARPLDGVNLVPYLTGKIMGAPHQQLFWRKWGKNAMAVLQGSMKLVSHSQQNYSSYQLFNLHTELGEAQNLRDSEPDIMQALIKSWNEWNAQMKDGVIGLELHSTPLISNRRGLANLPSRGHPEPSWLRAQKTNKLARLTKVPMAAE